MQLQVSAVLICVVFLETLTCPLKTLFWNAKGLTSENFTELKILVFNSNIDIIGIVEIGASTENLGCYYINGYQAFSLRRLRQVALGTIVYVKLTFLANMHVRHNMTDFDSLEAVEINV